MQWASSCPDLFGESFCVAFSKLQYDTALHAMKHKEELLQQAHGDKWVKRIRVAPKIVGSSCICQVNKGVIKDIDGKEQLIDMKVIYPNVTNATADDLDLLSLFVKLAQVIPFDVNLR